MEKVLNHVLWRYLQILDQIQPGMRRAALDIHHFPVLQGLHWL